MANKSLFDRERPPRVVTVFGHKLSVKLVPYLEDDCEELLGAFNSELKTIYLVKSCNWRAVLLHEIMHAILHYSATAEGLSMSKEESIVLSLEHGLIPILFEYPAKRRKPKAQ